MNFERLCVFVGIFVGLGACGGDESEGAGTSSVESDTDVASDTSEATGGETASAEGTSAADQTSGGAESSTGTSGEGDDSTSTGSAVDPESTYFRITALNVRDPHLFAVAVNVTDVINDSINEGMTTDDPDRPDGMLDLGFVVSFDPLDQNEGFNGGFTLVNAQCAAPVLDTTCDLLPGTQTYVTTYASMAEGECYSADPGNLTDYGEEPDPPTPTTGPCFVTAPTDVSIVAGAVNLPLSDARMAAQYVGDPANDIIEGNLEGFISRQDAENTEVSTPLGQFQLESFLDDDDADGDGWVFHIAFTAETVDWTGE